MFMSYKNKALWCLTQKLRKFIRTMQRFGIVGCGSIGKRHIAVLDAERGAELVAISDNNRGALDAQLELYPYLNGHDSFDAMLDAGGFEIVCIATPHALHADMTIKHWRQGTMSWWKSRWRSIWRTACA